MTDTAGLVTAHKRQRTITAVEKLKGTDEGDTRGRERSRERKTASETENIDKREAEVEDTDSQ